ncbi:outer membrane protein assembly factor BamB [Gordonia amarae]|nr:PQQ-binding-like beta-propeller repeat protein [Gordonia amarae]MCS3880198.1 outer membrane protein assembly factor BamB [Gordonia amarae]
MASSTGDSDAVPGQWQPAAPGNYPYPGPQQAYAPYPAHGGPPGYRPPPPRSRAPMFAAIAVACVAALAVVGGVMWWTTRSDDAPPLAGQLTREYPTVPKAAWTLTPAQLGGVAFASPNPLAAIYATPGPVHDGRTILTLVINQRSGGERRIAGVDSVTGSHWVNDDPVDACSDEVVGARIVCISGSQVHFIDTRTGRTVASHTLPGKGFTVAYDGKAAYVRGFNQTEARSESLTKVTAERIEWHRQYRLPERQSFGSGDATRVIATGKLFGTAGGRVMVYSADNGRLLLDRPGSYQMSALPDGSLAVNVADPQAFTMPLGGLGPVAVVRPDGTVTDIPGLSITAPAVRSGRFGDAVFVGGRPMTVDGTDLGWQVTAAPGAVEVPLAAGPYVALVSGGTTLTVADASTGAPKWSRKMMWVMTAPSVVTDGRLLLFPAENGALTAVDLETGADVWSLPASALGGPGSSGQDSLAPTVSALGEVLVAGTREHITGFAPTGGRASAPGSGRGTTKPKSGGSGGKYVTRCGSAPKFTPEKFTTSSGGLGVRMKVTATCPKGDLLSGRQTRVSLSDGNGAIASGTFDFSTDPLVLSSDRGDDSVTVDLTFPSGSFQRLPDTLAQGGIAVTESGQAGSGGNIMVDCDPGQQTVESLPRNHVQSSQPHVATPVPMSSATGGRGCSAALRMQSDSDRAFISRVLNNKWVAQLSSKRPGLVADGKTWDDCAILDEFLALRLRFDDARLLDSGQWPVFSYTAWWVTVATVTFRGPAAANSWCRTNGFDPEHCFAKLVSTTAGPDNSTRYWR